MPRNSSIDLFRGIAVIVITFHHIYHSGFFGKPSFVILQNFDLFALFSRGRWGVDLFFVISGYCMAMTYSQKNTLTNFYLKRFFRIYPAYLICLAFFGFTEIQNEIYPSTFYNSRGLDFILHILNIHTLYSKTFFSTNDVFWSLAIEIHFYIIFPFLYRYYKSNKFNLIKILIITTLFSILINIESEFSNFSMTTKLLLTHNLITFLPVFIFGIFLYEQELMKDFFKHRLKVILLIILTIFFFFYKDSAVGYSKLFNLGRLDHVITGCIMGLWMKLLLDKQNESIIILRPISLIGVASYSIYLYNFIFWFYMKSYCNYFNNLCHGYLFFSWVINFIIVISFGILMYYLIEKPILLWRSKLIN